jgi:hypothetical protein
MTMLLKTMKGNEGNKSLSFVGKKEEIFIDVEKGYAL